ncbi:hypothetical protein F0562_027624 [Nyssa sinensis]|uniref:Sialate O-acetylesterase domain-containing protein n=1 Tax=Nyssa sinensis TaxID=561372 RepID=A0A5J5B679_9ASTE|nr:hypothetical protein F0562_027624 [Nyssa sinensis]
MMLYFMSLVLLAHAWLVSPEVHRSPDIMQKNIFILAGQSNMAGRGGVINNIWDGIIPPECQPNPSILRLSAALVWEEAHEPLHADIDFNSICGVGPGMPFASAVLERDSRFGIVGLVPCAVGGTGVSEWLRGTRLYDDLVRRAGAALEDGGTIRAILWYQGERDTVDRKDAEMYKQRLEKFILDLRTDLHSSLLPVFQVALASGQGPFVETVRQAQLGINLPNVMCVDAKGLPLEPDNLHLSTPAQVRLGEMLADAFLQTIPTPIQNYAPRRPTIDEADWSG